MTAVLAVFQPTTLVSVSLDESSFAAARERLPAGAAADGRVSFRCGDLADPAFRASLLDTGGPFDLVVGDYLLAAAAGHRPFAELEVLDALIRLVAPGGRLVLTGLEPGTPGRTPEEEGIREILRWRDAARYLSGDEIYRELPAGSVLRRLQERLTVAGAVASHGPAVIWSEPVTWSLSHLSRLAEDAVRLAESGDDPAWARFLRRRLAATLKQAARRAGFAGGRAAVAWSRDWVIVADL